MNSILFTIGFTKKTAEEFFALLQNAGVRKVVDIRENPGGQLSGFAKHPDLRFFLDRIIAAEHVREPTGPTPAEPRNADGQASLRSCVLRGRT